MLLFSSSQRQQKQRSTTTTKSYVSSSPSFWIAQAVGALFLCPPDLVERWLPMVAPFPKTIYETRKRAVVDRILDDCWGIDNNKNAGYNIEFKDDDWIVDNQKQIRNAKEAREEPLLPTQQESLEITGELRRDNKCSKPATTTTAAADSLFSNYFLSLHLLFSLPSFGEEQNDDTIVDTVTDTLTDTAANTPFSDDKRKPSTYGEITPLGTRQLFGAMELLDDSNTMGNCQFVDLGSGAGKLVGHAVLELPTLERATGVELSPSRHQAALTAKQALIEYLKQRNRNENENEIENENKIPGEWFMDAKEFDKKLQLIEGDLFDVDLSTATHIYVASLCFPDSLMLRLEERLSQRIARQQDESVAKLQWIATLREFPNDLGHGIKPIIRFMEMSWTSPLGCTVYLYRCDST